MVSVTYRTIDDADDGARLDRWFKRHYPSLKHGQLEKLLRKGQIRIDGARAKANTRVTSGQEVRLPPGILDVPDRPAREKMAVRDQDAELLLNAVLHRDKEVIVINKPHGLATQGGTKTYRHVDGMLDLLKFDGTERPRLVHRLDRDTSGVLVLARTRKIAAHLAKTFQSRDVLKLYWALTMRVPRLRQGTINQPLLKIGKDGSERMVPDGKGQSAVTLYHTVENAGRRMSWIAMVPKTGRTHQLRVHMETLGCPIVGDRKYGGEEAVPTGDLSPKMHLHARTIRFRGLDGVLREVHAPLPQHMADSWAMLGFDTGSEDASLAAFEDVIE